MNSVFQGLVRPLAALALMAAAGCATAPGPYADVDNWLIRQNAVPPYFADYDVFYLARDLYRPVEYPVALYDYVCSQTVEKFGRKVRIFAPLVHDAADVETSFRHYLEHYHRGERMFVFVAEGDGSALLREFAESNASRLRDKGLVCGRYSSGRENFVTAELVEEIGRTVKEAKYRRQWARELPGREAP